jgi:ParB family chromosome partitioning protein
MKLNCTAINTAVNSVALHDSYIDDLEIDIDLLKPNPFQPRLHEEVEDLAASIKENGLLQAITINQDNVIVAGHRRYYAHILLNRKTIKANKIDADDKQLQILALIENIQREQLHPIELSLSYKDALLNNLFENNTQLAKALNVSLSHVSKMLNVLKLPNELLQDIKKNKYKLSIETLNLLLKFLPDTKTLKRLFYEYIDGEINRQDIKNLLQEQKKTNIQKKQNKLQEKHFAIKLNWQKLSISDKQQFTNEIEALKIKYNL